MKKIFKHKKAFTLFEIVIGVFVSVVITIALTNAIVSSTRYFNYQKTHNDLVITAHNLGARMTADIEAAGNAIYIDNGQFCLPCSRIKMSAAQTSSSTIQLSYVNSTTEPRPRWQPNDLEYFTSACSAMDNTNGGLAKQNPEDGSTTILLAPTTFEHTVQFYKPCALPGDCQACEDPQLSDKEIKINLTLKKQIDHGGSPMIFNYTTVVQLKNLDL